MLLERGMEDETRLPRYHTGKPHVTAARTTAGLGLVPSYVPSQHSLSGRPFPCGRSGAYRGPHHTRRPGGDVSLWGHHLHVFPTKV